MRLLPRAITNSLNNSLIFTFVLLIVLTALAVGLPAYLLVKTELEEQYNARLRDGKLLTQAQLKNEQNRLLSLTTHASQRPTLQSLLETGDKSALSNYLEEFKSSVGLDIIFVFDSSGNFVAGDDASPDCINIQSVGKPVVATLNCLTDQLFIFATQPVSNIDTHSYFVTTGKVIDDEFAEEISNFTGFELVFLDDGAVKASSIPALSESQESYEITDTGSDVPNAVYPVLRGVDRYIMVRIPLSSNQSGRDIHLEILLPIARFITADRYAKIFLILSTLLAIIAGSILGARFANHLIAPLEILTNSARLISRGDLSSPVLIPKEPAEFATLAHAFENSRVTIQRQMGRLTEATAWSETLIQSINEGIITFDDNLKITSFSQGAQKITGWEEQEALGKSLNEVLKLTEGEWTSADQLSKTMTKRQAVILTQNGRKTTLSMTFAQLQLPDSDIPQTALVFNDATEYEATQSLRSYFLANISHEFRTPLSAINASVEIMLEELEYLSKAEISELLNSIHRSVSGLQTLIDNLLESIRIEAGSFQVKRRNIEFSEVLKDAIHIMDPLIGRRRQNLIVQNPDTLPNVYGDSTRLTQVLVNLLSNASKYSPMGSPITVKWEQLKDTMLYISISDQGPGITDSEKDQIFRRFVRLSKEGVSQYGVGLGLSVVKAIVEEHGGEVGVKNNPTGGAIFWFTIPINMVGK